MTRSLKRTLNIAQAETLILANSDNTNENAIIKGL